MLARPVIALSQLSAGPGAIQAGHRTPRPMSVSLDGYIAGPHDRSGQELGHDGGRLFNWLDDRESDGPSGQVYREAMATGAVISGRRTFELANRWQGDHHDGVPIFVLTQHVDDGDVPPGHARFVTGVGDCARQARAAAGDRPVMVHDGMTAADFS